MAKNKAAKTVFEKRPPSHQKEILRYLNFMKTGEALDRNIEKVIRHLLGERPPGLSSVFRRRT